METRNIPVVDFGQEMRLRILLNVSGTIPK
jgi:hypothetical protein